MDTDFLLIRKMKQGILSAVDEFVQKYYGDLLRYAGHHCQTREEAEDLVQETFLRFFENLDGYRHVGKAKNYLYTIAGNLCRDAWKKKREVLFDSLPETGEDSMTEVEENFILKEALDKLPEEFREVLILHYFEDLKLAEIHQILQISLPLVKYRIKRGKELLKELLGEE